MDVYGLSDKGLRRELNEDSYIYEVNKRGDLLVCVCDGIGGSAAGEVASSLAVSLLQERFAQASAFKGEQSVRRWLKQVIAEANDLIFAAASRSAARKGMGTTCVGILRSGNRTFSFNVGDSRVYALYDDGFSCVTQDHSYIADLLRKGSITAEEAAAMLDTLVLDLIVDVKILLQVLHLQEHRAVGIRKGLCRPGPYRLDQHLGVVRLGGLHNLANIALLHDL